MAIPDGGSEDAAPATLIDVPTPHASRLLVAFRSLDRRGLIALALLVAGIPFGIGLGLASLGGFWRAFLWNGSVYIWTAALFGGSLTFGWWANSYPELWQRLEPVFDVPTDEYRAVVRPHIGRMYSLWRPLRWFPVIFLLGLTYDVVLRAPYLIFVPDKAVNDPADVAFHDYAACLADYCAGLLGVINFVFGIVSLLGILLAINIVINHVRLVDEVMELPLRDVEKAADELVPLARFNVIFSVGWFVSLTLGLALLSVGTQLAAWKDPLFSTSLLFMTLLGFVLFALPQVSIHDGIQAEKRRLLEEVDATYDELHKEFAAADGRSLEELSVQLDMYEARRQRVKEIRTWSYDLPGLLTLSVTSVVPLLLQLVQLFTSS